MMEGRNQGRDRYCGLSSLFEKLRLRRLNFERTIKKKRNQRRRGCLCRCNGSCIGS
jgi:hypothetical protein